MISTSFWAVRSCRWFASYIFYSKWHRWALFSPDWLTISPKSRRPQIHQVPQPLLSTPWELCRPAAKGSTWPPGGSWSLLLNKSRCWSGVLLVIVHIILVGHICCHLWVPPKVVLPFYSSALLWRNVVFFQKWDLLSRKVDFPSLSGPI